MRTFLRFLICAIIGVLLMVGPTILLIALFDGKPVAALFGEQ